MNGGPGSVIGTFSNTTATLQYATLYENGNGTTNESSIHVCTNCDVSLRSTIVWTASALDRDCSADFNATYTSLGYNIDSSGTCAIAGTDLAMTDPRLQPLDGYGFPTTDFVMPTMPPRASSPAVDLGGFTSCQGPLGASIREDQLGRPRPVNPNGGGAARCDSGAIEYQAGDDPGAFLLSISLPGNGAGRVTSNPQAIDCPGTCSHNFDEDSLVALQAVAANGSRFDGWGGACSGSGTCQVTMDQASNVSATFTLVPPATFPLVVSLLGDGTGSVSSTTPGIDCPGTCAASFNDGTIVTLQPLAANGSEFTGWSGHCSGTGACQVSMTQARNVSATFTLVVPDTFPLSLSLLGDGTGSVSSTTPGIDCPGTCAASFNDGTIVTLQPLAANGSEFTGWSGHCSGSGACQVTMDQARNVSATFTLVPPTTFPLVISLLGDGTGSVRSTTPGIDCPGTCAASFNDGTVVTLQPLAASGSRFTGWSGHCSGSGACQVTMDQARNVSASFNLASDVLFGDGFE